MQLLSIVTILVVVGWSAAGGIIKAKPDILCSVVRCKVVDCIDAKVRPGGCCPTCPVVKSCWYKGKFYKNGASFKDDCNSCFCRNGKVACTKVGCPKRSCFYKGKLYKHGASFKAKCNTCRCNNGRVTCTKKMCLGNGCRYGGKYYKEGERIQGKNPCKICYCKKGKVDCNYIRCKAVDCLRQYKRPGMCCPACPRLAENQSYV